MHDPGKKSFDGGSFCWQPPVYNNIYHNIYILHRLYIYICICIYVYNIICVYVIYIQGVAKKKEPPIKNGLPGS